MSVLDEEQRRKLTQTWRHNLILDHKKSQVVCGSARKYQDGEVIRPSHQRYHTNKLSNYERKPGDNNNVIGSLNFDE